MTECSERNILKMPDSEVQMKIPRHISLYIPAASTPSIPQLISSYIPAASTPSIPQLISSYIPAASTPSIPQLISSYAPNSWRASVPEIYSAALESQCPSYTWQLEGWRASVLRIPGSAGEPGSLIYQQLESQCRLAWV